MLNLQEKYKKEVIPAMMEKFGYKNPMAVPRIEKVVVNTGFGRQVAEKSGEEQKRIESSTMHDLSLICGQKPVFKKAKKSIAAFKLREGLNIGTACTLRRKKMYDFLDRLIHIVLPRSRDFRGIDSKSFDKSGNLTIGMKEHIAFPEILSEKAKGIFGLEITIATNAKNKEEGSRLLKLMGFPIK
jgi:large subunit ribosomal protein L5